MKETILALLTRPDFIKTAMMLTGDEKVMEILFIFLAFVGGILTFFG